MKTDSMKPFKTNTFFTDYIKPLSLIAFPVMLENLGQIFLGTVDTFFAGKLGDNAIAAISVTNLFINLLLTVFTALGIGIMVKIGRSLGEDNTGLANIQFRQAVLTALGCGAAFGLISLFSGRLVLTAAGAKDEILELALIYFPVVAVPCVFLCVIHVLASSLKACKNSSASMKAALSANVMNAVLDALFVHMGLGVFGLALATTLSRLFNVILLAVIIQKNENVPLTFTGGSWKPQKQIMTEFLAYSIPVMLTRLSARLCILAHGSLVLRLGSIYYVANSITTQLDEYACIPSEGYEAATATMVSRSLGSKNDNDVLKFTKAGFLATSVCMTALGLILAVFSVPLTSLFTKTTEIYGMARQILTLMVFFNWTSSLSHILTSAVQGAGNSRLPLYATLIGNIVMRLGVGYLLAYTLGWKLLGIWIGIILDFLLRGIILGSYLIKRFAKAKTE